MHDIRDVCSTEIDQEIKRLKESNAQLNHLLSQSITLRDQFAMAALTGLLAGNYESMRPEEMADECYIHADAMMKQRQYTRL